MARGVVGDVADVEVEDDEVSALLGRLVPPVVGVSRAEDGDSDGPVGEVGGLAGRPFRERNGAEGRRR